MQLLSLLNLMWFPNAFRIPSPDTWMQSFSVISLELVLMRSCIDSLLLLAPSLSNELHGGDPFAVDISGTISFASMSSSGRLVFLALRTFFSTWYWLSWNESLSISSLCLAICSLRSTFSCSYVFLLGNEVFTSSWLVVSITVIIGETTGRSDSNHIMWCVIIDFIQLCQFRMGVIFIEHMRRWRHMMDVQQAW